MPNLNKIMLMGNLTREVELSYLPSQTPVAELSLAINRKWQDAQGQQKEEVTFVECSMFGKRAEVLAKYVKKGQPIYVEGRLKLESWEAQDGSKRSKLKVIIENFEFLGSKPEGQQQAPERTAQAQRPAQKNAEYRHDNPTYGEAAAAVDDSRIPF